MGVKRVWVLFNPDLGATAIRRLPMGCAGQEDHDEHHQHRADFDGDIRHDFLADQR